MFNRFAGAIILLALAATAQAAATPKAEWVGCSMHLWTGVKLYYGEGDNKAFFGEVLGGNESYTSPITGERFRGVKITTKKGKAEWKDRDALITSSWCFIRKDDPALERMEWREYRF
jgi:hypothetical protein